MKNRQNPFFRLKERICYFRKVRVCAQDLDDAFFKELGQHLTDVSGD